MQQIIQYVFGAFGIIVLIPSILFIPAIIILGIMGFIKKDFSLLKKYFKIWAYSLVALVAILIFYGITNLFF